MSDKKEPVAQDSDIIVTPIAVSVHRRSDNPIFGESSIRVMIEDEANGPFIVLTSNGDDNRTSELRIDMEELEAVTVAARKMMADFPSDYN